MLNTKKEVYAILNSILPTKYGIWCEPTDQFPCITYTQDNESQEIYHKNVVRSLHTFEACVWALTLQEVEQYAQEIDTEMRANGLHLIASQNGNNDNLLYRTLLYEGYTDEYFHDTLGDN